MRTKWWVVVGMLLLFLVVPARIFAQAPAATPEADLVFQDDFSGDGGYVGTYQAGDGRSRYAGGVYQMTVVTQTSFIYGITNRQTTGTAPKLTLNEPLPENVSIEVDATLPRTYYQGRFGIAVGWQEDGSAHALLVGADGRRYTISRVEPLTTAQAADPTDQFAFFWLAGQPRGAPEPAIGTGARVTNHLRVDWTRTGLILYVNGQKLAEYPLEQPLTGDIALFADAGDQVPFRVDFDNLVVRRLPAASAIAAVTPQSGQVLYRDDFSDPHSGWRTGLEPDRQSAAAYKGGTYQVTLQSNVDMWYSAPIDAYRDVSAEVTYTFRQGHPGDYAAVVLREIGDVFYDFCVGWDGTYMIGEVPVDGDYIHLVDWLESDTIYAGDDQENTIRADVVGDTLTFYINDQEVEVFQDEDIAGGYAGIEAGSATNAETSTQVTFDDFVLRQP